MQSMTRPASYAVGLLHDIQPGQGLQRPTSAASTPPWRPTAGASSSTAVHPGSWKGR